MTTMSLFQQILQPISAGFVSLGGVVNPVVYPFPWFNTLHAARISLVFQTNTHKFNTHSSHGWKSYIGGFCLMCWGGMIFSHFLLNLPPPVLYAPLPWINYISVHLILTFIFSLIPSVLAETESLATLDFAFFPIDAMLRTGAVVGTLAHLAPGSPYYDSINPSLVNSPLFHFILGCTASAGGGVTAASLGVWNPNWGSGGFTPVFLRKGPRSPFKNILSTLDVWGGGLVAIIYGLSTSHAAFRPVLSALSPYIYAFFLVDMKETKPLSPMDGKSLAAAVLMMFFGIRAFVAKMQTTGHAPNAAGENKEKKQ
ncbi:hypothetical protein BDP27DRAFT_1314281 [Rhodocollybia butyracea]|uniref:Uncharacterized protein n=1 Tax=Rhodocollybia butyracea TaxID=206335 RepID=A0A9P5UDK8_9AGAR|nr:hypothetical protein BDP27DRAFT_1314281 [Rhodocollybia butyracea]